MKPEPLKGKWITPHTDYNKRKGQDTFLESDIRSAVEFYKLYYERPQLLIKNFPKWKDKILEAVIFKQYKEWLLNKAFEDVVKEKWHDKKT